MVKQSGVGSEKEFAWEWRHVSMHIKCISSQNVFSDLCVCLTEKQSLKSPASIRDGYMIFCCVSRRLLLKPKSFLTFRTFISVVTLR